MGILPAGGDIFSGGPILQESLQESGLIYSSVYSTHWHYLSGLYHIKIFADKQMSSDTLVTI